MDILWRIYPASSPVTEYAPTIRGLKPISNLNVEHTKVAKGDGIRSDNQGIETYTSIADRSPGPS